MKRAVPLTLLFAALTVLMAAPWSLHPATRVLADAADTHLFLWTLGWDAHAFATNPFGIFDANIFHPDRNTLAYSENLIGSAFFAAPIIWATGNLVLGLNIASLLTCLLCGLGAYFLARTIGLSVAAGIIAGIVFAFDPSRFFRISQLHLTAVQWVPFGLAFLHRYVTSGRPLDLRLAILFLVLQALSGGHGAVFLIVAILALAIFQLIRRTPIEPMKRLRDVGIPGLLLILPAVLIWLPYRRAQVEMGLRRTLENWTVTPNSFIASPSHAHQWLASWFTETNFADTASAYLFPGVLPIVLAVTAIVPGGVRDPRKWFYLALAILSVLLFVPPPLGLWPLVYWLPAFNFIRVPSRFIILATLALAILAAFGFERIARRWSPPARITATIVAAALLLAEFTAYPLASAPYAVTVPAIDRWLATQPSPMAVAELPTPSSRDTGPFVRHQTRAMLHSTAHWEKIVHGYSGIRSPRLDEATMAMTHFPADDSLKAMRDLGVTHIVIHTELYAPGEWTTIEPQLRDHPHLRLLHVEGDGRAYLLVP